MRIPRFEITYDNALVHMTWQCHNKEFLLKESWAKQKLYDLILENKNQYGIKVYAYMIMDNHPHFIFKIGKKVEFSRFMQKVHSAFAMYYNKEMQRRGQVVMDRPKTPVIENDQYLMNVMFYLDLNSVATKKPVHPSMLQFTSYHYYAFGKPDPIMDTSPVYLEMGFDENTRQLTYRNMVDELISEHTGDEEYIEKIEEITCYLGSPDYVKKEYEKLTKRLKEGREKQIPSREFNNPWNST